MSAYAYPEATTLQDKHIQNARLLNHRIKILPYLPKNGAFVEIGVAFGDFSEQVLDIVRPKTFYGLDLFDLHEHETLWGVPRQKVFGDLSHEQFYARRLKGLGAEADIHTMAGDSVSSIETFDDQSVDVFYVDADHSYEGVKRDITALKSKIKPDGTVIFNDFIMYDHLANSPMGIVQAATEFIVGNDYEIIFFALHHQMFCDIAVRKIGAPPLIPRLDQTSQ